MRTTDLENLTPEEMENQGYGDLLEEDQQEENRMIGWHYDEDSNTWDDTGEAVKEVAEYDDSDNYRDR